MGERVLTHHSDKEKKGRSISKEKYDAAHAAIIGCLQGKRSLTHGELMRCANDALPGFAGSIDWYVETVKLDLEARGVIERTPTKPATYRLPNAD